MINPLKDDEEKQELVKSNIKFLLKKYKSNYTKLANYLGYKKTTCLYKFLNGKDLPKNKDIFGAIASYFQISTTMLFSEDLKEKFNEYNEDIFNEETFKKIANLVEKKFNLIKFNRKYSGDIFEDVSNFFIKNQDVLDDKIKLNELIFRLRHMALVDKKNADYYYISILYFLCFKYLYVLLGNKYLSTFNSKKANPLILLANSIRNVELNPKTKMAIFELRIEYEAVIKTCIKHLKDDGANKTIMSYVTSAFMMLNSITDIFKNKDLLDELDKNSESKLNKDISKIVSIPLYNMFCKDKK